MKEKLLDKDTIDAYHTYVQSQIRTDLNSISLGPGRLPTRLAQGLTVFGLCCLLVGFLLIVLRMKHVYFWDWQAQFVGPFFVILFLMCISGATYLVITASRRANRFRRELYFHPLGDYGIAAVHKDDLMHEQEMKHDLKSGTTPHKNIMPSSDAYSQINLHKPERRAGHHNQGYHHGPSDPHRRPPDHHRKPPHPDDHRRGPPPGGRRGPPPDDRRRHPDKHHGPPPDGRRGPPPQGEYRRGPPPDDRRRGPDDRRGPPPEGRRGPPPDGYRGDDRRGPPPDRRGPPDDRRGPPDDRRGPPDDRRGPPDDRRGPPPDRRGPPPPGDRRGPPPDDRRGPPPDDRRGPPPDRRGSPPPGDRRGPPPDDRRPRGVPHFKERSPDDDLTKIKLTDNKESESEL